MPSYVCRRTCQVRMPDDSIRLFDPGTVYTFPEDFEVPDIFDNLDGTSEGSLDFLTASEEELLATEWLFADAQTAMSTAFGKNLVPGKKPAVVAQILDIRYRNESKE